MKMTDRSLLRDTVVKCIRVIVYLVAGLLVLLLITCLLGFHGDGWVRPAIRVQVNGADGSPIEEATVIFFEREGQRDAWLHMREQSISTEDYVLNESIGTTNGRGQTEVQGSFGAAFYLYRTHLSGRGILRVEKLGYLPAEVVIDSRERRREILNELLEFGITLKREDAGQPHEL